jgi:hypothetical protein
VNDLRAAEALRTMLRDFSLEPTSERDERWHSRRVASAPAHGGRAVVHRRHRQAAPATATATAAATAGAAMPHGPRTGTSIARRTGTLNPARATRGR